MISPDDFAARLRALIARHSVSLEVVADRIGRSKQVLSKWQHGRSQPRVEDVARLCDFFGCTADYLVGLSREPNGIPPGRWILNAQKLQEARSTGKRPKGILIELPDDPRLVPAKEAWSIIRELDLKIE